ncbi:probable glycosyltransferase At5g03795 isoform X4 [Punica granatum]|uniref:Probable glycosyltransferase At5g03795 isoform X4 n=1 Tax=Punica granatum TaxID=22663 RepID=A0A6P8CNC5_PUNGR|nr:probable glycosyltransferase At5g03795 isoform X4 [Punica granatum]
MWSLSPSAKLVAFMVPFILVSVLLKVVGPRYPGRVILSDNSWLLWSFGSSKHDIIGHGAAAANRTAVMGVERMAAVLEVRKKVEEETPPSHTAPRPEAGDGGSVFNVSGPARSPTGVEVALGHESDQTNATIEDSRVPTLSTSNPPSMSEAVVLPEKKLPPPPPLREYTILDRLEAGLRRARSAIREQKNGSSTSDPDYVPIGPMYRNANAFHRSYLEMEKQFKIFVYEEGEPPVFHNGPCKSIYAMEGNFIHMMEISTQFRTGDPEKAHVFFLPFSVTMMVQFVYVQDSHDFGPIKQTVIDYLNVVSAKYPYWNRSLGADHFMLACHDWGPETSRAVPNLYKNSIRVLCNANTSEGFNPSKDISFPEINLHTGGIRGLIGGPSPSHRPILAFFAGGLHGPIRPILLEHWEHKNDPDMQIHKYLRRGVSYIDMMRKSKFCICPSGYEVASPRVVEAIYTGCIPVLISDHYVPPFSDVLNWKSFSVEVPVSEIPNLKNILASISPRQYIRMQRRVVQIRRHFEVNSPPKRFDVFHMILHSLWLRRLNVRVHDNH